MAVEESPNAFSVEWNPTIFSSNCQTSSSSHIQVNPREDWFLDLANDPRMKTNCTEGNWTWILID